MHRIRIDVEADYVVLVAEGELDAFVAPELSDGLAKTATARATVLDLRAVSFLDSTALGILVRAVREIRERGAEARVVLPGTPRAGSSRSHRSTGCSPWLPLARRPSPSCRASLRPRLG